MSSLERAKAFAKRSVLPAAMTILPLALAAVNADAAAVTLTPKLYSPSWITSGLSVERADFTLQPSVVGDVDGQKLTGSGHFSSLLGQSSLQETPNVTIRGDGPASGVFTSDTLGVKWDFTIAESSGCGSLCTLATPSLSDWTLDFTIFDFSEASYSFSTSLWFRVRLTAACRTCGIFSG